MKIQHLVICILSACFLTVIFDGNQEQALTEEPKLNDTDYTKLDYSGFFEVFEDMCRFDEDDEIKVQKCLDDKKSEWYTKMEGINQMYDEFYEDLE